MTDRNTLLSEQRRLTRLLQEAREDRVYTARKADEAAYRVTLLLEELELIAKDLGTNE